MTQLLWYLEDPLPPEASLASFSPTTSSLRRLYLLLPYAEADTEDIEWFKNLLSNFTVLEKILLFNLRLDGQAVAEASGFASLAGGI